MFRSFHISRITMKNQISEATRLNDEMRYKIKETRDKMTVIDKCVKQSEIKANFYDIWVSVKYLVHFFF